MPLTSQSWTEIYGGKREPLGGGGDLLRGWGKWDLEKGGCWPVRWEGSRSVLAPKHSLKTGSLKAGRVPAKAWFPGVGEKGVPSVQCLSLEGEQLCGSLLPEVMK